MSYYSDPNYSADGTGDSGGGWFGGILGGLGSLFGGSPGSGLGIGLPGGGGSASPPSLSETLTGLVDASERAMKANLAAFQLQQIGASDAIERGWAILNDMVSRLAAYGAEGNKAGAERDRRIDPTRLRWDWIAYYIDPINGGPTPAQPLPVGVGAGGAVGSPQFGVQYTGGIKTEWLLIGAGVLAVLWFARKR